MHVARPAVVFLTCLALTLPAAAEGPGALVEQVERARAAYLAYSVGRLMETQGLFAEALVQFRRAASLDPGACELHIAVARALLGTRRLAEAEAAVQEALLKCPGDTEATALYARILLSRGEPAKAETALRGAIAGNALPPDDIVDLLADALAAQGRIDDAADLYGAHAAADTLSARTAYLHARALIVAGRLEEAVAELRRSHRLAPDNRATVAALGRLLVAAGRQAEAIPLLASLVNAGDATDADVAILAGAYSDLGRGAEALAAVEDAIAAMGETPVLLGALGSVLYELGDSDGAIDAHERLLAEDPDFVPALNFIAYTLAEEGRELPRALEYATRAVALDPDNGRVRDTLGWTYYMLGRYEEAERELSLAVEAGVSEAVIYEHLGDARAALGDADGAAEAWETALAIEPARESVIRKLGNRPVRAVPLHEDSGGGGP